MRTLCDVCESAAAILFCAADEAALCPACDDKVHMCNKLASRHVRVGLAEPSEVPRCDICENAPAFFYCEVDGSSLCLQCDMIVHVGGKRTHGRYLLLRQRIEVCGCNKRHCFRIGKFAWDKIESSDGPGSQRGNLGENTMETNENQQNHRVSANANNINSLGNMENNLIDLNSRPQRMHGQGLNNQERGDTVVANNHEYESVVPDGYYFKRESEK
ncbi:hypothetical protein RD792_002176 [Penstemon davidsonii]|uniref:B box-type domain-containing protein n=1 Tax=Penstemon davidsonii TaxID=160366 RepID=A0ABR0DQC4_9LAMI|nr:hypothetical protein RD792_002176 [Penstemon davidsonii]